VDCCLQLLLEVVPCVPNISNVRLVNAAVRGRDGAHLAAALLQCRSLRTLQLHQVSCLARRTRAQRRTACRSARVPQFSCNRLIYEMVMSWLA
jgi:NAD-dependent oxidoreductase involved in siderophore biosynthesis